MAAALPTTTAALAASGNMNGQYAVTSVGDKELFFTEMNWERVENHNFAYDRLVEMVERPSNAHRRR